MSDFLYTSNYNPDVLSCLANLSNEEVFTSPEIANQMLDMLPEELWHDKNAKFLDPTCKSGVFLREIAKRLLEGLKDEIPDLQQRINHIFQNQLYGIAITELTSLLSRRSVYCSKYPNSIYSVSPFDNASGNIRFKNIQHRWLNGRCVFCGASESGDYSDESRKNLQFHAYEFIHTTKPEEIFKMKFDVIIGNPPYQMSDGGSAGGAMPIYQKFVEQAKKLNPRFLSMIIPSRWFAGGRGLNDFRNEMLNDRSIREMVDYPKSRDCFQGVDIAGGICYFLIERGYSGDCKLTSKVKDHSNTKYRELNEFSIFIRDNIGIDIIHKVITHCNTFMDNIVAPVSPFGLRSFARGTESPFDGCLTLNSSAGKSYIRYEDVKKGIELIEKYKVTVGYLNPDRAGVNNASDGKMNVTTKIAIYQPREIVTETYIILGSFETLSEAQNCASYIRTKFARFLLSLTLSSMHITKINLQFVPVQDFSKSWTDDELYTKYDLSEEEIAFIESMIRPMDLSGGDDNAE